MKIIFITSGLGLSGGNKAIFELANCLTDRGHQVFVVCSLTPFIFQDKWFNPFNVLTKLLRIFKKSKGCGVFVKWFDLKATVLSVPSLREKYIPDADIILSTWWETAYFVKKYSKQKGEKFYFVQDYEDWVSKTGRVRKSYQLGLKHIVNSSWLKKTLKKMAGTNVESIILHAPDHKQFYPQKIKRKKGIIRILMPYRDEARKGTQEGLKIIELVQKKYPNIQLVLFGKRKPEHISRLLDKAEFHLCPVKDELRKLYNSCDIFLYPSLKEGFGMPPMEAMACCIPVVTTNAGAISEYTLPGKTALVSEPGDIKKMAKDIIGLIENPKKRKQIACAGQKYIQNFRWEKATKELEAVFKKYL
ncbi:glycosyltransferase family 1 protein [bacterium]|nr:MAG: glycosyltransferase family 1 protein [bacterium]